MEQSAAGYTSEVIPDANKITHSETTYHAEHNACERVAEKRSRRQSDGSTEQDAEEAQQLPFLHDIERGHLDDDEQPEKIDEQHYQLTPISPTRAGCVPSLENPIGRENNDDQKGQRDAQ
jgi:hypothetical protein